MEITGSQKIKASREQVFQGLLNQDVLKNSIPGCEGAETFEDANGKHTSFTVTTGVPGFKGPYRIDLQTTEVTPPSHLVLTASPSSSVGSVVARCPIDLTQEADGSTLLSYSAHAELSGKIAATPEFILKGAVKGALDHFFKSFEKQVLALA
ncbi:CoxG family protein [Tengunoibacter tsumagoiensis]|uniref:Carbon monoxide dehydrogenase n=1 Tax=Tengunoibacter tsumagoiensis TaxID=2014871 RepID=A0A401ZWN7_9CHLR|nr:SRPBCC domain-containing protein [Tengunoibacter tsumagoiensis]GCE11331.1 carbon monoxide dehydrogenase [Tengunoibacter tsumagoiensis]